MLTPELAAAAPGGLNPAGALFSLGFMGASNFYMFVANVFAFLSFFTWNEILESDKMFEQLDSTLLM